MPATLDALLAANAQRRVERYFADPPGGAQLAHYTKLRAALDSHAALFARKLQEHAAGPLRRLNGAAALLGAGGVAATWEDTLPHIGDIVNPEARELEMFCETVQAKREGHGSSGGRAAPTKEGSFKKNTMTSTVAHLDEGDHSADEYASYCAKARNLCAVAADLTKLYDERKELERLWAAQVKNVAACLKLHALKDDKAGHVAGKPLSDAVNSISKKRQANSEIEAQVSKMTKERDDAKAKLAAANAAVAAAQSTHDAPPTTHVVRGGGKKETATRDQWSETIKKQCCTVL
eukprot:gene22377-48239_t